MPGPQSSPLQASASESPSKPPPVTEASSQGGTSERIAGSAERAGQGTTGPGLAPTCDLEQPGLHPPLQDGMPPSTHCDGDARRVRGPITQGLFRTGPG